VGLWYGVLVTKELIMTDWIEWNGGECPIKSDKTRVKCKLRYGYIGMTFSSASRWSNLGSPNDIIAYRIIDDHEPKVRTREQITAQIEALQKQLDALPVVTREYWGGTACLCDTNYFDIETINGVPHIHGVAMKEVGK
jgi:hypothetical protein